MQLILSDFIHIAASDGQGVLNSSKPIAHFHRSTADRVAAANLFVKEVNFFGEVVCDSMANEVFERIRTDDKHLCEMVTMHQAEN